MYKMTDYKGKKISNKTALQTKLVRVGSNRSNYGETSEAIFMNSGFCYDDAAVADT